MDVSDGNVHQQRGTGGGEYFVTVAQHHDHLGLQALEGLSHAGHGLSRRIGDGKTVVVVEGQRHLGVHLIAVGPDGIDRMAELRRQVRAGGHHLQFQRGIGGNLAHQAGQQAVIGARAGDEADAARHVSAFFRTPITLA